MIGRSRNGVGSMKKILIGLLFGSIIGYTVGVFLLRPKPITPIITVNPPPEIERQADLVATVRQSGKLSGQTKIPIVKKAQDALDSSKQTFEYKSSSDENKSIQGNLEPFTVTVPVDGEIESIFVDVRTGEELGRGVAPVSGETTVAIGETVQVETVFRDELKFSIDIPKQQKRNEVGIVFDGAWTVYYKRELANIGPASLWAGVSYDFGDDLRLAVGVSVKW